MRVLSLLIIFCFTFSVYGQNPKIDKANKLVLQGKGSKAISLLKKTYKKTNDFEVGNALISIYEQQNQIHEALTWANKVGLSNSNTQNDAIRYAELLMRTHQFQKAIDHCLNYAIKNDDSKGVSNIIEANEKLFQIEKESFRYKIRTVPFNTVFSEISITNYRKNFVMSSNGASIFSESNQSNFDLFMLQQDYDKWRFPWPLLRDNNSSVNRTTACYSFNGNEVFYTLSPVIPISKSKKAKVVEPKFNIYHALSLGDQWVENTYLPFQDEAFSYKDPALHPNENILVFASNKNGNGDYDLFYSVKENGVWSEPKDLGQQINTKFEERMPYFKEDGKLYFASNHPHGFGGYDIYTTKLEGTTWIASEILPPPINSKYDDLSMIFNLGISGGYLVSNRPEENIGGYDVFAFDEFSLNLSINVVDDEIGNLLSFAEVQLYRDSVLIEEQLTSEKGEVKFDVGPNIEYQLVVTKEGYLPISRKISSKGKENGQIFYENFRLQKKPTIPKNIEIENQTYITFKALFENEQKEPLKNHPVKLINVNKGKMKLINTDENGEIEQYFYFGNNYKIVVEYNDQTIIKDFSTVNFSSPSVKKLIYTLP